MRDCVVSCPSCANSETPRETAPCADPGTTKVWAAAPSTKETHPVRRLRAAAPDSSRRRRRAVPAVHATPGPGAETNSDPSARPARPACSEPQLLIRRAVIGHMALDRCGVMIHAAGLAPGEVAYGGGESWVGYEMRRARQGR